MSKEETHQEKVIKLLEKQSEQTAELVKEIQRQGSLFQKQQTTPTPTPSDSKPSEHWKAEDLTDDCPECKREKEKIAKSYLQNLRKEREKESLICDPSKGGCGLGVKQEEENCPFCGGKDARKR